MKKNRDRTNCAQSRTQPLEPLIVENNNKVKIDWTRLLDKMPDPVWRHRWDDLAEKYGLPFKRSYMQNLDSEGRGPEKKYLKNRVAYPLPSLITWLNSL